MEGARNDFGNTLNLIDFSDPLRLGTENSTVIHFLEGFTFAHAAFNLAHEQDHGGGILIGDVHAGVGIGGTRATCDHADARLAREFAVRIGHHGRPAFLAANSDLDIGIVQTVEHGQVTFARHTEHVFYAVSNQLINKDVSTHTGRLGSRFGFHGGQCVGVR